MKFDLNDFRTDKDAKTNGVWIEFGGNASFKLASFDNAAFTDAFRKATKPYTDLGRKIPDADQAAIMARCMANHIVLDWKGVYDGDKELKFSVAAAERLLTEIEMVRDRLIQEARSLENFKAQAREETEKN
jgi:hypothetical protein